jgi:hypothetical protein
LKAAFISLLLWSLKLTQTMRLASKVLQEPMAHLFEPFLFSSIFYEDLGLIKKNERWLLKVLSKKQMEEKVEASAAFFKTI